MHEYPARALAFMDGLAEELGIWLFPNLRLHNGTDGLESAGAPATRPRCSPAAPTSSSRPTTTGGTTSPRTSTSSTVADGIRLSEAAIRRLGKSLAVEPD